MSAEQGPAAKDASANRTVARAAVAAALVLAALAVVMFARVGNDPERAGDERSATRSAVISSSADPRSSETTASLAQTASAPATTVADAGQEQQATEDAEKPAAVTPKPQPAVPTTSGAGSGSGTPLSGTIKAPIVSLDRSELYPRIDAYSVGWKTLVDQYGTGAWTSPAFMHDGVKEQRIVVACMGVTTGSGINLWNKSTFDEYPQWMGMSIAWIDEYRPVIVHMNEPNGLYVVGVQPYSGMDIPYIDVIWRIRIQEKL